MKGIMDKGLLCDYNDAGYSGMYGCMYIDVTVIFCGITLVFQIPPEKVF